MRRGTPARPWTSAGTPASFAYQGALSPWPLPSSSQNLTQGAAPYCKQITNQTNQRILSLLFEKLRDARDKTLVCKNRKLKKIE